MRLSVIQMDMRLGESAYNFAHAEALLRRAAAEGADTALLPETWNTGFFPADHLPERSDRGGEAVKALCAPLARELNINIVAGSVSDRRGGACTTPPMSLTGRARVSQPTTKRISLPRWASTSTTPPAITSRPFRSTGTNAACSSATTSASPSFSARWRFRASSCCSCPRSGPPRGGIIGETLHSGARHRKPVLPRRLQLLRHGGRDCVRRRVAHPRSPRRAARRRRSERGDRHRRARFFRPCGGPQLHQRLSRPSAGAISSLK